MQTESPDTTEALGLSRGALPLYCLSVDLVGSTRKGLSLRSWEADKFNLALIGQITPHLEALRLDEAVVKFTGDGWLVMSPTAVSQLCCLALIFRDAFRKEMAALSGLRLKRIPHIRAALCYGYDREVQAPGGRRDYVGDSARRAVRASGLCKKNEVLVHSAVRDCVLRDFDFGAKDVTRARQVPAKWEEEIQLYVLRKVKTGMEGDSTAPADFVYTLGLIGKHREAISAALAVAQHYEIAPEPMTALEQQPSSRQREASAPAANGVADQKRSRLPLTEWNRVLHSLPDYAAACALIKALVKKNLTRDVVTYNILTNRSPSLSEARNVLRMMAEDHVSPDVVTYNTLVNKAETFGQATGIVEEMKRGGVAPNVVTYNTLVNKAETFGQATGIVEEMKRGGVAPNVVTYNTLVNKAETFGQATGIVEEMKRGGVAPDVVTYNTLVNKAETFGQATEVVEEMKNADIVPDTFTYGAFRTKIMTCNDASAFVEFAKSGNFTLDVATCNALLDKASNYVEGIHLVVEMKAAGLAEDIIIYQTLFSKRIGEARVETILNWYYQQPYHSSKALGTLIKSLCRLGRIDEALEIALQHPYLEDSRKLMRFNPREALDKFELVRGENPHHPTADLAIGALCLEQRNYRDAKSHLTRALRFAVHFKQRRTIREWLANIG